MLAMRVTRCPACQAMILVDALVCPACGAQVAIHVEDLRLGRLFLLMIAGSVLGGIVVFTGAMFYVGISDTYRLVIGAWGFTALVVLGLAWLAGLSDEARGRLQRVLEHR